MAAELTYSSLLTDVPLYCDKVNDALLLAQMPRLVMLAENRIATDLKTLGVNMIVTGTLAPSSPVIPKPTYWRDTVSLFITWTDGEQYPVLPRSYSFCRSYWPTASNTARPKYYADYGYDHYLVVPTPPSVLPFELSYHARLDPLDASHQTNWITVNAPQVLLHATMVEAQLFLKNDDGLSRWVGMYTAALQGLKAEDAGRKTDQSVVVES